MFQGSFCFALCFCLSASAANVDAGAEAQRDVERELHRAIHSPPSSVEIRFDGIDSQRYELVAAEFELDGQPLLVPSTKSNHGDLFFGRVVPEGPHTLVAKVAYRPTPNPLFSYLNGYRFEIPARVVVHARSGLALRVRAWVHADERREFSQRLQFVAQLEPQKETALAEDDAAPDLSPPTETSLSIAPTVAPPVAPRAPLGPAPFPAIPASLRRALAGPPRGNRSASRLLNSVRARLRQTAAP
jgi:hypothetical protein